MKAVFIISPSAHAGKIPERLFGCSYTVYPMPNLAILYPAAVLEKADIEVSIFDGSKMSFKEFWKKFPKVDFYLFQTVLLSAKQDIKIAKNISKNKKVIFFGPQPTYNPKEFLLNENCLVARGEIDFLLREIVISRDPTKLNGVSFLKKGRVYHNKSWGIIKNLDDLPFPVRELDKNEYRSPKLKDAKFTTLLGSRQCAYRCYFCVPNSVSWARELEWKMWAKRSGKPPVKTRSAKNIVIEVRSLIGDGYKEFSFIDDQFLWDKKRTLEICHGLRGLGIGYGILARADRLLDEEVVKALAESGCGYVDIGVESFDQKVLDNIKKDLKISAIQEAVSLLNRYKINPKLNVMFGTSFLENESMLQNYLQKTLTLPVNYCMYSIATPFPGTEFEKVARKKGWLLKRKDPYENFDPAQHAMISYPHLSSNQLESTVKRANRSFYLRPRIILRQLLKTRSLAGLISMVKGGLRILTNP